MEIKKFTLPLLLLSSISTSAFADVVVHVLDTNMGRPGADILVSLYQKSDLGGWTLLDAKRTNDNGQVQALKFDPASKSGKFKLAFQVSSYFEKQKINTFFDSIPVEFIVPDTKQHYHVPIRISPFAYSTNPILATTK